MTNELQDFKDLVAKSIFGGDVLKDRERGLCVKCREPAIPKCYSPAGIAEYGISGLCELCFDKLFEEPEEVNDAHAGYNALVRNKEE